MRWLGALRFGAFFCEKIRASKKKIVPTSLCRRATLKHPFCKKPTLRFPLHWRFFFFRAKFYKARLVHSDERQRKFITEIHAHLVFQACISFLRCFRTPGAPIRKIVHAGMLPTLYNKIPDTFLQRGRAKKPVKHSPIKGQKWIQITKVAPAHNKFLMVQLLGNLCPLWAQKTFCTLFQPLWELAALASVRLFWRPFPR